MSRKLETIDDVRDALGAVRTAMLTTVDERGTLSARPLTVQEITSTGDIWFLVDGNADWVRPSDGAGVNVAMAAEDSVWVSFAGTVALDWSSDRVDALTGPSSELFIDDEMNPVALRVRTETIEWWSSVSSTRVLFEVVKAALTNQEPNIGSSGTIAS